MKGQWKGYYVYDKKAIQERVGVDRTFFTIIINSFDGEKSTGIVEDDQETKGTPGIGEIIGELNGNTIKFTKQMPIKTAIGQNGELLTYNRNHRPIYYEGTLSGNQKAFSGTWKMKFGFSIVGFFILFLSTKGAWQMEKIS